MGEGKKTNERTFRKFTGVSKPSKLPRAIQKPWKAPSGFAKEAYKEASSKPSTWFRGVSSKLSKVVQSGFRGCIETCPGAAMEVH